ncbi:MAG: hypothetical protein Q8P80_05565 [Candidatus Levybacteria bacterium]|nr:hypothetical protein [Candidatus Levybacteria bacterium]
MGNSENIRSNIYSFEKGRIDIALQKTRQSFLREGFIKLSGDEVYHLEFDRLAYQTLVEFKDDPDYDKARERLNRFTDRQLKTLLAEREHTLLSTTRLRVENGVVYPENDNEAFINMVRRGRDYRRIYGNQIDFKREDAELAGQEEVIEVLSDAKTKEGTMFLSISPKGKEGSSYKHNFFDIFILESRGGEKYIEIKRYSSPLLIDEFVNKFTEITGVETLSADDAFFLSHPIKLEQDKRFNCAGGVAEFMGKDNHFMSEEDFKRQILSKCQFLIDAYKNALYQNPNDAENQELIYKAIQNKADEVNGGNLIFPADVPQALIVAEINRLGNQKVRQVSTGCGFSGGSKSGVLNALEKLFENKLLQNPFRVSDFKEEWFQCPKCSYKADGPIGGTTCPGCHVTAEEFYSNNENQKKCA